MTRVIQFLHPGAEHAPDKGSSRFKSWNFGNHRRKFLQGSGQWTSDIRAQPRQGSFTFWGEWEPQSSITTLAGSNNGPSWLHSPLLNLHAIESDPPCGEWQNSDPFVFGDQFLYGICRQFNSKSQKMTKMARLENGDIILFGSHIGGNFVLDTLFVVGNYVSLENDNGPSVLGSNLYQAVTLDRIQIPKCGLRLYSGQSWSKDAPFSFVPCQPIKNGPKGFSRPIIRPEGQLLAKISPMLKQNFKEIFATEIEDGLAVWKELVTQVLNQGCALGTRVDEPTY